MHRIFAAPLLLLCSCLGSPAAPTYTHFARGNGSPAFVKRICIDSSFDDEDRADIVADIQEWNVALNGQGLLMVGGPCDVDIIEQVVDNKNDLIRYEQNIRYSQVVAFAPIGGNKITILRHHIDSQYKFRWAVLHEIGHMLGADHASHGLMNIRLSYSNSHCIDYNTLAQVCRYQNINCSRCNYCVEEETQ